MNLYENLKYRVDLITDDEFPDEVSSILQIPGIKKIKNRPKSQNKWKHAVIKYIGLLYDPKSPYPVEFRDLDKRKQAVAEECGFTRKGQRGEKYWEEYQQFMDLDTDIAREAILDFLHDIHYSVWTEIQTTEQELWEITQLRWEKITTKKTRTHTSKAKGKEGETTSYDTDIADKAIFDATSAKGKLMDEARRRRDYLKDLYEEMYADNLDAKAAEREVPISPENAVELV